MPPRATPALDLHPDVVAALRERLADVATQTVLAITREVGEYAALEAEVGETIEHAVQLALATFLRLAGRPAGTDPGDALQPATEGAYALGRGEARSGRTMEALLAAYRVGARVSWREWSAIAVGGGSPAGTVARFAELVFAYIDELSAASVAGHADELARTGRVREQYLQRLGAALVAGADEDDLVRRADQADWPPPRTLTAVLLPSARVRSAVALLPPRTLLVSADVVGRPEHDVVLVPDADRSRPALLRALSGSGAVVGPARPWTAASASYLRALRTLSTAPPTDGEPVDTEEHLVELVLTADADALADLRAAALAPLREVRPGTADRLVETLRCWLLHQGRRDDVAAALHVHPQTVRYRMQQVRDLYGERLADPDVVRQLTVALALPHRSGDS